MERSESGWGRDCKAVGSWYGGGRDSCCGLMMCKCMQWGRDAVIVAQIFRLSGAWSEWRVTEAIMYRRKAGQGAVG